MVILFPSAGESCRGDHGRSSREEEGCSVSERCALEAADKDVLVGGRSHGLILMTNLASMPFYSKERREYDPDHLPPFPSGEL